MLHGHLAPRGTAWKIQETGNLWLCSPASEKPKRLLTDVLEKRREMLAEEECPATARRPREGPPAWARSLLPFPGAAQESLMSSDH